ADVCRISGYGEARGDDHREILWRSKVMKKLMLTLVALACMCVCAAAQTNRRVAGKNRPPKPKPPPLGRGVGEGPNTRPPLTCSNARDEFARLSELVSRMGLSYWSTFYALIPSPSPKWEQGDMRQMNQVPPAHNSGSDTIRSNTNAHPDCRSPGVRSRLPVRRTAAHPH